MSSTQVVADLEQCLSLLLSVSNDSALISNKLHDGGKFLQRITSIKASFMDRRRDVAFVMERERKRESGRALATMDGIDGSVTRTVEIFRETLFVLDQKIKKVLDSVLVFPSSKRNKIERKYRDVKDAWSTMMLTLTHALASESTRTATAAAGDVAKLALASGHPDWQLSSTPTKAEQMFAQAERHLLGVGCPIAPDIAFRRFMAAAKDGLPEACVMVGSMYEKGIGRQADMTTAVYWYKEAANRGSPEGWNHLGRIHELGKGVEVDHQKAAEYYLRSAEAGDVDAITNIGYMFEAGVGRPVDATKAAGWYRLAADEGYARAQNCLGAMYYHGRGVTKDATEAVIWWRKAAEQGNHNAQNNLGICYEEGAGVMRDYVLAKQLYRAGKEGGHANATNNLAYIYLLENNHTEAFKLFNLAMALGSTDAIYNLGTMYDTGCHIGQGAPREPLIALRYFREAAKLGLGKAALRAGRMLTTGDGCTKELAAAAEVLRMAAEKGDPECQNAIGQLYELGLGVAQSYREAKKWYSKSEAGGDPGAAFNLGGLYETGSGVDRNLDKAVDFYTKAMQRGSLEARQKLEDLREYAKSATAGLPTAESSENLSEALNLSERGDGVEKSKRKQPKQQSFGENRKELAV